MNFNLFEAGRRLTKVVAYIIIAIFVVVTLQEWERKGVTTLFPLALILLAIWLFARAVGWILRGLLGIPDGADYRFRRLNGDDIDPRDI